MPSALSQPRWQTGHTLASSVYLLQFIELTLTMPLQGLRLRSIIIIIIMAPPTSHQTNLGMWGGGVCSMVNSGVDHIFMVILQYVEGFFLAPA